MTAERRHPQLSALDLFVGEWRVEAVLDTTVVGTARSVFEWQDGGAFLRQTTESAPPASEWARHAPSATTWIIGLDDSAGELTMLYDDSRGVQRVYRMAMAGGAWTIWRNSPGFHQRFTGTFGAGGRTITGHWAQSPNGVEWEKDFDLNYTKVG
ncbi:MAG: hypothetical protein ACJ72N_25990 [Labedaea sp.]